MNQATIGSSNGLLESLIASAHSIPQLTPGPWSSRPKHTGVTLHVQGSDDHPVWEDLAISVSSAPFTGAGFVSENRSHPLPDPGMVEFRDILNAATTPRRQMRLRVEIVP